jgi:hypothetical protein
MVLYMAHRTLRRRATLPVVTKKSPKKFGLFILLLLGGV